MRGRDEGRARRAAARAPRALALGLSGALTILGCQANSPRGATEAGGTQADAGGAQAGEAAVPITPEPAIRVPDVATLPAALRGAPCAVAAWDDPSLDAAEQAAFAAAFEEHLLGEGSPFVRQGDASIDHRFVALPRLTLTAQSRGDPARPDLVETLHARAQVELHMPAAFGSRSLVVEVEHPQPTSAARRAELRLAHGRVTGKLLARRLLATLAELPHAAVARQLHVVFRGFRRADHVRLREDVVYALAGVDLDGVQALATGNPDDLVFVLPASVRPTDLAAQLRSLLDEAGLHFAVPAGASADGLMADGAALVYEAR